MGLRGCCEGYRAAGIRRRQRGGRQGRDSGSGGRGRGEGAQAGARGRGRDAKRKQLGREAGA